MHSVRPLSPLDFFVIALYLGGIAALGVWADAANAMPPTTSSPDAICPGGLCSSLWSRPRPAPSRSSAFPGSRTPTSAFSKSRADTSSAGSSSRLRSFPRYYNGHLVTAYALLEQRFGTATRRFTSIVFMATRAMADSVRVFATAIPISLIVGNTVPQRYEMPVAVLILGLLTVLYTYRGGMRAVVWTEIVQAAIYISGGAAAAILVGRLTPGGWSTIIAAAGPAGKLRVLDWYTGFDPAAHRVAELIGGAFLSMASHGADQLIVQRLLSSRSLRDARMR